MNGIILISFIVIGVSGCSKGHSAEEFVDSQIPVKEYDVSVVRLKPSDKYCCRR